MGLCLSFINKFECTPIWEIIILTKFDKIGYVEATEETMSIVFGKDFKEKSFFDVKYNNKRSC